MLALPTLLVSIDGSLRLLALPAKAGSAAAVAETSSEFDFALGIAALGSLAAAVYRGLMANAVPGESRRRRPMSRATPWLALRLPQPAWPTRSARCC